MMTMGPEKIVCIDPGHGGKRDGAKYGWAEEDDLNLEEAFFVDYELRLEGVPTILTRQRDRELAESLQRDLRARVNIANEKGADIFLSIHFDAYHNQTANGMTIHVHPEASRMTRLYAGMLYDSLRARTPNRNHRGIRESDFYVLRHTRMAAVLVECEFLSNPESRKWIHEPENLRDLGKAISSATVKFCRGDGA